MLRGKQGAAGGPQWSLPKGLTSSKWVRKGVWPGVRVLSAPSGRQILTMSCNRVTIGASPSLPRGSEVHRGTDGRSGRSSIGQ